ncbi:hypothetical protein EON79_13565 [bacterium]|nr:MAG: hypothetical protein EON79_13565 [bacterium]
MERAQTPVSLGNTQTLPGQTPVWDFGPFGQWRVRIVAAEPSVAFAYRRNVIDPAGDPFGEGSTLVEFRLEETGGGTVVHHSETGFLALPPEAVEPTYRTSEQIWAVILGILEGHLAKA